MTLIHIKDCLDDVRGRAINELAKIGLSKSKEKDMPWTAIQFWKIVQLLSKYEQVDFDNVRYHTLFKGDGSSILAMERSGIVSITRNQGKEQFIRAGRPILQNAFKDMTSDQKLISTLGIETTNSYIESETKKLKVLEEELQQLTNSYNSIRRFWIFVEDEISASLKCRIIYLSTDIKESSNKIKVLNSDLQTFKKSLE